MKIDPLFSFIFEGIRQYPNYYTRFGFKPIDGLILPDVPPEYFQAILFQNNHPTGTVTYHESFLAQD